MIIDTMYENLAKFQLQKLKEAKEKRTDRELKEEFGKIEEQEEETIWRIENGK